MNMAGSDQEMSEDMDSDNDTWSGFIPGAEERREECRLGKSTLLLPELFLEKKHIFKSVMSMEMWDKALTSEQRQHLEKLLPTFPTNDTTEKLETLRRLFCGDNFKFGNPMENLQKKLKEGYMHPEIACYRKQMRQFRFRDYKMRQQRHLSDLLKHLLLSRQDLFEHALTLAPGESFKMKHRQPPKKRTSPVEQVVRKKTVRILKEVREECGVPETSSDEEEDSSPVQRSRRQLFKSLGPIPSPEPTLPSVLSTFASKPPMVSGDVGHSSQLMESASTSQTAVARDNKRLRPISPVEVTEESYKEMLRLHKRKKMLEPELPEFDTSSVTLTDILTRCRANKKHAKMNGGAEPLGENVTGDPAVVKKKQKVKVKGDKKRKLKGKESPAAVEEEASLATPLPSCTVEPSASFLEEEEIEEPVQTVVGPATNFFSLLRDILLEFPDERASTFKVEDRVSEWLDQYDEISNPWLALQQNWIELVAHGLRFLCGNELGLRVENFVPLIDYKERAQQWKWIGTGRDSDADLTPLFRHWLQHKDEVKVDGFDITPGSPPPPKAKTTFIVRPTSSNEKALFREQERRRFAAPHKAFTFMMHGYDSVVGPVKGVYDKESGTTKAREHNLLVSDRPPFVTILTLVRDAAARLPNGEGTRGDICELLKDSQFLAPGVTETQINAVVSGALDRLHSEKDPCVKYDVTRKLWIYLHRNRTEDEFERIHQAQAAAVKAKKTLSRPKTTKTTKDPTFVTSTPTSTPLSTVTSVPTPSKSPVTVPSLPSPTTIAKTVVTDLSASLLTGKVGKLPSNLMQTSISSGVSSATTLSPTVAQLRASQAAMSKSLTGTGKQTVKQLTSGQNVAPLGSASFTPITSSLLNVTSLGLSVTSSLAAQLLYSPSIGPIPASTGKMKSQPLSTATTATTFSLVTTMNASQTTPNQPKPPAGSSFSMLPSQQLLKQQQQQQQQPTASQSVLKQNAALIAAVNQTVAAAASTASGSATSGKPLPTPAQKQTFTMAARQTPPPNIVLAKNQAGLTSSKVTNLKPTSLMISQEGIASLTSSTNQPTGKLVALTNMSGVPGSEGTVMAQIMQQATAVLPRGARAVPQTFRFQGSNTIHPVLGSALHIGGKPLAQAKGLLQLATSKGTPTLNLIRTPQGPLSAINLIPQSVMNPVSVTASGGKTATILTPAVTTVMTTVSTSAVLASSQSTVNPKTGSQPKILSSVQAGLIMTQLAQGNITLRQGTAGTQAQVLPTGQASLMPTQFILQPAPGTASNPQATATPIIVSNASGGQGAQNLQQVMRTVLAQQANLKPGQAAILISQPPLPQTVSSSGLTGLTAAQMIQAGSKSSGRGSPKGKVQPVYARIITPPPGMMKLANLAQVPAAVGAAGNVSVIQTMGKLLVTSGMATHTLPSLPIVSLAVPSAVINPVAAVGDRMARSNIPTDKVKPDGSVDS